MSISDWELCEEVLRIDRSGLTTLPTQLLKVIIEEMDAPCIFQVCTEEYACRPNIISSSMLLQLKGDDGLKAKGSRDP